MSFIADYCSCDKTRDKQEVGHISLMLSPIIILLAVPLVIVCSVLGLMCCAWPQEVLLELLHHVTTEGPAQYK